jgi:hypothetical protein
VQTLKGANHGETDVPAGVSDHRLFPLGHGCGVEADASVRVHRSSRVKQRLIIQGKRRVELAGHEQTNRCTDPEHLVPVLGLHLLNLLFQGKSFV